ncbi:extracellular solute-binding protein (plasmid) [Rathayibacter sp. VKM Ac-2803]|uniref:Sugar ABC transporter substrate-binding protein n=1 Tax=Rathayibacter caricis DSM 15933 TaxID=1328867 RepID=A0A2T4UNW2_9MICO|nr:MULTISPECIES: sugar ABC transporter substrate-binding protein [Rathayibacter]MWV51368.1 extracellular solute-binding protein [Rathayibacter sp. VKM Ac-2803]PTL71201.1 sugar ABC transporter substrate-binding protein [Rathayibacter caricis DSM 15933]
MFNLRRGARRARTVAGLVVTGLAAMSLVACSSGSGSSAAGSADDLDAALEKGGSLTYWTWTPSGEAQAEAFMKEYPNVDVEVVNAGTATDEYTKLQNSIKAGSGAPDVAQIEYYAMQQFALSDGLLDLTPYGMGDLEDSYTASTWGAVNLNGGLYGLPQDSGPMVMLYNKTVFDQYGLAVPTTWDEYIQEAQKLHSADPSKFITNDAGDPGFADPLIWQAGGTPFTTDGTDIAIDLQDEGTQKWADTWNQLLEPGLLSPIPTWSDEWFTALGNDSIATLITGAWMPGILENSVPDGAGDWRVAPLPSYDGSAATAENGGSAQSVIKQSENPALAAAFLRWLNSSDESIDVFLGTGGFPSTTAQLEADDFLNATPEYFGGQEINKVLVDASKNVVEGFEYLPFQVYANSVFPDTVGQAYANGTDLNEGLKDWQDNLVTYGDSQGFSVNE